MGLKKALKTGAPLAGAAAGFAIGGPSGAMIGYGAGGALGGMLGDDAYSAPSFADIDLASANPQLWAELQRMNATVGEAERLYNARRQGPTEMEMRNYGQARSNLQDQQAYQGLLGTSAGLSNEADVDSRLQASIRERAFQEEQALLQNLGSQRSQYAQAVMNAQNQVMNPQMQASQMNFQQQQDNNASKNQFYSGMFNAGLGMYGNEQNMARMDAQMAKQQSMYPSVYQPNYNPYGAPPAASSPQYGYNYSSGVPGGNNAPFWER